MKTGISFILLLAIVLVSCVPAVTPPPAIVHLNQIDVFLIKGTGATGTFTIELRDAAGNTPALWSNTVPVAAITAGVAGAWNSFTVPTITLTGGQTYRIYVTRSDAHDTPTQNTITWRSSDTIGVDRYTAGVSSTGITVLDFAFRTYDNSVVDQKMETMEYGLGVSNTEYRWQGFVPGS
jgi:hypothetical protein